MNERCQTCKYAHVDAVGSPCVNCKHGVFVGKHDFFMPADVEIRPNYYRGEIECIDAMIQTQGVEDVISFCVCNAFKYIWRWKQKNGKEDLKKALWYLKKAIELISEVNEDET